MLSSSLFSKTLLTFHRCFTTGTSLAIKSPGGREKTPSHIRRPQGRFQWTARARWVAPTLREINRRKGIVAVDNILRFGTEKMAKRSEFLDWNYNSELFAFQARVGETFVDEKLREAFITPDFLIAEETSRQKLGVHLIPGNGSLLSASNNRLVESGSKIVEKTLSSYIRLTLPKLPADGVDAVVKYLTNEDLLAHVSFHIGTKDLVLSEEYPPSAKNMSQVFLALVAALNESSGPERAIRFVLDLVGPQLHGLDLTDVWNLQNPMGYLAKALKQANMGEPVSRLLWVSGKETILACYHVGIYSDKELIGQAPGETGDIAEEMAARDALRRLYRFDDAANPFPLGKALNLIIPSVIEDNINVKSLSS